MTEPDYKRTLIHLLKNLATDFSLNDVGDSAMNAIEDLGYIESLEGDKKSEWRKEVSDYIDTMIKENHGNN